MNKEQLISSFTDNIPEIRRDIQIIPIRDNGRNLLYFHDPLGYLPPDFALDGNARPLLSIFSGAFSIEQISDQLKGISKTEILSFVQLLDRHCVLNSRFYRQYSDNIEKEFEMQNERFPALAGKSYPDNPARLSAFLDDIMDVPGQENPGNIKALYAPHIDIEIGKHQYASSFSLLNGLKPKKVIILATGHYTGYHSNIYDGFPFIGSTKTFRIPGRSFKPAHSVLNRLQNKGKQIGFTLNDRAHRVEHSIELHLLLASAVWQHEFQIVPILVSGFDELFYHQHGDLAQKVDHFSKLLRSLVDDDTFILISGDISHVGKKFGDSTPAREIRNSVEVFDHRFLDVSINGNADDLLNLVSENYDGTRICGFPPLYTFLKTFPGLKGERINYHWWDEHERESAVSFGSVIY
jgi:MEMO1 family protein